MTAKLTSARPQAGVTMVAGSEFEARFLLIAGARHTRSSTITGPRSASTPAT
jgi:hypothetical protein